MSAKPDYEAALAEWKSLHGWQGQVPKATLSVVRLIVDAALGGDPTAFAVDALIAEGGEIREANPDYGYRLDFAPKKPGRWLV